MVILKDPDAILDYGFNWTSWLATGETITTSTWVLETGLTEVSTVSSLGITSIFLSGGVAGEDYIITNRIVTSAGRTDDRSHTIRIVER
jgi:hypothetical protein